MRCVRHLLVAAGCAVAALGAGAASAQSKVVTIYSADGLRDGKPNWYDTEFKAFTKETGIKVQYVEGGSGVVVERVNKEKSNPQADVLVTLPPFIQKAKADGVLQAFVPDGADQIGAGDKDKDGTYYSLVNNYFNFIYNAHVLKKAPKTFEDLLAPKFKNKIQYSTPGQAGDGTAVMLLINQVFGSKDAGFGYMKKLQANNRGPSSSTGKLTALVNKGELWLANGDMQMNFSQMAANPNIKIFWPAGPNGERTTFALPYYIALVHGAPHSDAGKKLITFLLTKDAQSTISSIAKGMPSRQDVHPTDANYKKLNAMLKGVKIWTPDWDKVLADLKDDVARWHSVTGS